MREEYLLALLMLGVVAAAMASPVALRVTVRFPFLAFFR